VFFTLFNLQGARRSQRQEFQYIISRSRCQALFSFFSPAFPPASMIQHSHSAHPLQPFQLAANFYMIPLLVLPVKHFFHFIFDCFSRKS
ncbi:hypothetical protein, partial [Pseudoflavonifractor phocaeensis]|uniref:hypothetical protein n=1 Tax=Pseudoflavonifractor phocaeensis TaxID=1870988 RepID=UPI00210B5254